MSSSKSGLLAGLAGLGLCLAVVLAYFASDHFLAPHRDHEDRPQEREPQEHHARGSEQPRTADKSMPTDRDRTTIAERGESPVDRPLPSETLTEGSGDSKPDAPAQPKRPIDIAIESPMWEEVAESLRRSYRSYERLKGEGHTSGGVFMMVSNLDVLYYLLPDIPRLVEEKKFTIQREVAAPGEPFTATVSTRIGQARDSVRVRVSSREVRLAFDIQKHMVPEEVWRGIAKWTAQSRASRSSSGSGK